MDKYVTNDSIILIVHRNLRELGCSVIITAFYISGIRSLTVCCQLHHNTSKSLQKLLSWSIGVFLNPVLVCNFLLNSDYFVIVSLDFNDPENNLENISAFKRI